MKKVALLLIFLIFFAPAITVNAADAREVYIYLYSDYEDCVFFVCWENMDRTATLEIVSPDGVIIVADEKNTEFGKGRAYVSVGMAKSGYWIVRVEGKELGMINISGGSRTSDSARYNAIQGFDVNIVDGYLDFRWDVAVKQDFVNVSIYASAGEGYSNRAIWTDYSAEKCGTANVSMDDLQTGLYHFTIQVYDGSGQYSLSTAEPIYVKQSKAPVKLENIKVGSIDGKVFAAWDACPENNYIVTLYDYDTLEVLHTIRLNSEFCTLTLDETRDRIKFSVAAVDGNVYGEFDVFEIVSSVPAGMITFPDLSVTRESALSIHVNCSTGVVAGLYLDGTLLLENAGSGDYDLILAEGSHEIVAFLKDGYGNIKSFSKSVTVDQTPPIVNLSNPDNIKTGAKSIVVNGSTEPNATVSINGIEQELGTGRFMAKLMLEKGINPIKVAAYDLAGNKSVRTITAESNAANGGLGIYVVPGLLFVLLGGWYVFLNKKPKEGGRNEKAN